MPVNNNTQPLQEVAGPSENNFLGICVEGGRRKWKVPINHMACLSDAQVNAKNLCYLQYVYLFLSWISFPVWNPSVCFLFFGKVLNHMVRQSNFLVCFLSSFLLNGQAFLTKITTTMCARICLKYGPVKIEIRFVSLKAALILHIFWDLEDFSWTDSKLSSFSCNGKDKFPSTGFPQNLSSSQHNHFFSQYPLPKTSLYFYYSN